MNFIHLSARYNILVLIVNIVGIPTCSQHLLTWFVRRPDDGHIRTETCSLTHNKILCVWCKLFYYFNPLNAELNPICHLLALLGGATIVVVSRLRVNIIHYSSTATVVRRTGLSVTLPILYTIKYSHSEYSRFLWYDIMSIDKISPKFRQSFLPASSRFM